MFEDPEANHSSKINYYYASAKVKLLELYRNRFICLYSKLTVALLVIFALRTLIPHKYIEQGEILLGTATEDYSKLHPVPYDIILSSEQLVKKYSQGVAIEPLRHPQPELASSLQAIKFKKQLNNVRSELIKALVDNSMTCIPAISVGLPYNVLLDKDTTLYLNMQYFNKTKEVSGESKHKQRHFKVKGTFGGPEEDFTVFEQVDVKYVDAKDFTHKTARFESYKAYCVQIYLQSFDFNTKKNHYLEL